VVTNQNDSGAGSFRDAVATGGTITFAPGVRGVSLDSPVTVSTHVDIVGPADGFSLHVPRGLFYSSMLDFASGSSGSTVTRLSLDENDGHTGIKVESGVSGIQVTHTPMWSLTPAIELLGTGAAQPGSLKAGPRQADGTLPISGVVSAPGTLDVYEADLGSYHIGFVVREWEGAENLSAAGPFTFTLPANHPWAPVYVTLTNASGTSQWAAVDRGDIESPWISGRPGAVNNREVVVTPSEPLAPESVGTDDFSLTMGGSSRTITQARYDKGAGVIHLVSSQPWKPGQQGAVALSRPGAVSDLAGNQSLTWATDPVGVAGLPADFKTPSLTALRLRSHKLCFTRSRHCKRVGTTIAFTASEPGQATFQIYSRRQELLGSFVKQVKQAGRQRIGWRGRLNRKLLRPGRYAMAVSMTDSAGSIAELELRQVFRVIRATH
jgi:hypothetical protein